MVDSAVRQLYRDFSVFDGAYQATQATSTYDSRPVTDIARSYADGKISRKDLQAVIDSEGFTVEQKEAAQYLLDNQEVFDSLDVSNKGGQPDNRVSQADVLSFIDARRPQLSGDTVRIVDAAHILAVGRRDGTDDYNARIIALARQLEGIADVSERRALIAEIVRQDPGAYKSWLQSTRLRELGPAGTRDISQAAHDALQTVIPYAPAQLPEAPPGTVRVATYNIGQGATSRGEGPGTDYNEIPALASNIAATGADVICVQELFANDVEKLRAELERATGREVFITFSEASEKRGRYEEGRYTLDSNGFGNAVITFSPQQKIHDQKLPHDGDEGRSLLGVTTQVDGQTVTVFTTHISSQGVDNGRDPQSAQFDATFDAVGNHSGPVLLTGDFNARLGGDGRPSESVFNRRFEESGFEDAGRDAGPTSVSGHGRRIDYVFTDNMTVEGAYTLAAGTSDHAGVVVDVRI